MGPQNVAAVRGSRVEFNCQSATNYSLLWLRSRVGSVSNAHVENGLITTDLKGGTTTLVLERVMVEDAGLYTCSERRSGEERLSELVVLGKA